jgi:hypothetical protein
LTGKGKPGDPWAVMDGITGSEFLLPAALGIGLAAATGFRVFVPLLALGLAARAGLVPVSEGFAWVASTPALLMLGIAAFVEVAAYYVPGLDNLLDAFATPAAVAAGIAVSAAVMTEMPPMLKWTLAIIAGGGAAGLTQGVTALARGHSTVLTGGLGNAVLATGEIVSALALSAVAIMAPWLALAVVLVLAVAGFGLIRRFRRGRQT